MRHHQQHCCRLLCVVHALKKHSFSELSFMKFLNKVMWDSAYSFAYYCIASMSVLLVYAWPCTTIYVIIWRFKSFQKCIMWNDKNVFIEEKSCNKITNIFISCVVNLCIFHFSDQAHPLLPPSLTSKCAEYSIICMKQCCYHHNF